jgi:hypothetical protein
MVVAEMSGLIRITLLHVLDSYLFFLRFGQHTFTLHTFRDLGFALTF